MARVEPATPRAHAADTPRGYEIVIPARRHLFVVLFLSVWLCGWAVGWTAAASELFSTEEIVKVDLFLAFWLTLWTIGGVAAVFALFWSLAGRQVVTLGPATLTIAHRLARFGRSREYDLEHVSNLRVSPLAYSADDVRARAWGFGGGSIAFDYGAATVRFGGAVEDAEAQMLVDELVRRRPSLGPAA